MWIELKRLIAPNAGPMLLTRRLSTVGGMALAADLAGERRSFALACADTLTEVDE
jgi:hypothetical protein